MSVYRIPDDRVDDFERHIGDAVDTLTGFIDDARADWDDETAGWQDSEHGRNVQGWLERLDDIVSDLEEIKALPRNPEDD